MTRRPTSYVIKPSGARADAVATCKKCGRRGSVVMHGGNHNPAHVQEKFRRQGWEFDSFRRRSCVCPLCIEAKKNKPTHQPAPEKEPTAMGLKAPSPSKTALSPSEKTKVRTLLDGHFDEQRGCYLDSYSDQRIGKECNVPWALVTKLRELAYGDIREDIDAENLRSELRDAEAKLQAAEAVVKTCAADLEKLAKAVAAISAKVDRVAQNRAG